MRAGDKQIAFNDLPKEAKCEIEKYLSNKDIKKLTFVKTSHNFIEAYYNDLPIAECYDDYFCDWQPIINNPFIKFQLQKLTEAVEWFRNKCAIMKESKQAIEDLGNEGEEIASQALGE